GTVFKSIDEARTAIFSIEEKLGHIWKTDQSKVDTNGHLRKVTLRCHRSRTHVPVHLKDIDPSDLRRGRSIKTSCTAHINVNRIQDNLWHLTTVDCCHNHDREVPVGGSAPHRPIPAQQELYIRERLSEGQDWCYDILLDTQQKVTGLWWMSPAQVKLARRYWDLLLNDDSYNRNLYGYPTNIGIVVAGDGMSRNVWYAFHESEDIDAHNWVFRQYVDAAGWPPLALFIDRHPSLIASATISMPLTQQFYCLHHLDGNITQHLRPALGGDWESFKSNFWLVYRAPSVVKYLQSEIYPCRDRWAWAWISTVFTAGIRTTGRPESENRVTKLLSGPKQMFYQVFQALVQRSENQETSSLIRSSRHQHPTQTENIFSEVIKQLRLYAGPFALQKSWSEMDRAFFYNVEVIQLPRGATSFVS
ncbi:hypothetical protein BT96DRAFT_838425, partial [Gymnopus androsaceus JB14]